LDDLHYITEATQSLGNQKPDLNKSLKKRSDDKNEKTVSNNKNQTKSIIKVSHNHQDVN